MPGLSGLLKILSPVFPFALVGGALLGLLNGLREMKKYAAATIIQSVLMVIITVALIYYGFGVAGAVIGVVLSSIGSCTYLIWICRAYFDITLEGYTQTTRKLLRFGAQIIWCECNKHDKLSGRYRFDRLFSDCYRCWTLRRCRGFKQVLLDYSSSGSNDNLSCHLRILG